jgi:formylglycine-generating enzyme required for sulfatase activity
VAETAHRAKVVFDRGEFPKAYELWGQVVQQIDQRYKSMLPGVRKSYENALNASNQQTLEQYGGKDWRNVEDAVKQAALSAKAGRFGKAVAFYKRAENLLALAVSAAKTASQDEELKAAIKSVGDLIKKGSYYKAQAALGPMLKSAPSNPRLVDFKKVIDQAIEIKIYLQPNAREERGGLVMKLSLVTPGKFQMGSPKDEAGREKNETLHEVEITKPFYIGQTEVSRRQFEHFVKATGYKTAPEKNKKIGCIVLVNNKLARMTGRSWRNPGFVQGHDHPVVCVSWEDANEFCKWLSNRSAGMTISLPTEAQWEYACRQGTQTRFSFGDDYTKLCQYGNYGDGSSGFAVGDVRNSDDKSTTAPVQSYKIANGDPRVYDMHGNVSEWCSDFYGSYAHNGGVAKAAIDPTGIARGVRRIVRGGSWVSAPAKCRSAYRGGMAGVMHSALIGFRVAATGKTPTAAQLTASARSAASKDANWKPLKGRVGVGSWATKIQYRDLVVRRAGKEIYRWKNTLGEKKKAHGKWWLGRGSVEQRGLGQGWFITFGDTNWTDYTVSVKAKKTGGKEGFRVIFAHDGGNKYYLFNVGGKNNTKHCIEKHLPGKAPQYVKEVNGKVEQGPTYDIKVELKGRNIRCFVDNKLVCEFDASSKASSLEPGDSTSPPGTDLLPDFSRQFTVTAWVRTKNAGTIFAKTSPNGAWARGGKTLFVGRDGRLAYDIGWSGTFFGKTKISDNKWHHVALVGDSGKQQIYVDGRSDGSGSLRSLQDVSGSVGIIAFTAREYPKPSHFTGLLDDVCLYERAMSQRERSDSLKRPQGGLVGHWSFEGDCKDNSPRKNHAVKVTGARFVSGKVGKALAFGGNGAVVLARGR